MENFSFRESDLINVTNTMQKHGGAELKLHNEFMNQSDNQWKHLCESFLSSHFKFPSNEK